MALAELLEACPAAAAVPHTVTQAQQTTGYNCACGFQIVEVTREGTCRLAYAIRDNFQAVPLREPCFPAAVPRIQLCLEPFLTALEGSETATWYTTEQGRFDTSWSVKAQ